MKIKLKKKEIKILLDSLDYVRDISDNQDKIDKLIEKLQGGLNEEY